MQTIASHTLVRNGQPFLDLVLRQVEPFVDRMLITISEKSEDGSLTVLRKLEHDYPEKVRIYFENVKDPAELTKERQKQVNDTIEDWILFLDDDDYWPEKSLKEMVSLLNEGVDGYAVSPIQVVDQFCYDKHWYLHKYFTKWFRNIDITYHGPWPRDMFLTGDKELYWKKNTNVKRLEGKYFHLSNIKPHSFRNEAWTLKHYEEPIRNRSVYPDWCKEDLEKIYNQLYELR
jgi:glycosyltransferase involved in cell wall biosynthesis